ncbi:MarR family winged helix-turn-helix transcriptional regulator [Aureimonas leprariae]|uniref:Winged helix-turn-helix transcriptional regulator n=1 Tax=Plantimonas leprariae TaxID=2615207 RepID=A0A7V7PP07_9HYPH|nr:MarR family winged helix-turn-helix transcriptional regulator [Aureimonas leprariae]KAB0679625.1 winged helix-turn-helix transcriptional regulator [Aureimonas leprariae]
MSTAETEDDAAEAEGNDKATAGTQSELVPVLLSISKSSRAFLTLLLAEIGLHPGQDQLLRSLGPGDTVSVSVLAEQLAVRPSTVSKMLDRLIERNLVRRASSNQDARRTMVALTPAGVEARDAVQDVWNRLEAELKPSFGEAEFEAQMRVLEKIDAILAARLRRLR